MLLKAAGSILILAASSFLGHVLSADCRKRPRELRELQNLLQLFENEIGFLSNVLADAFEKVYKASQSEVGEFFRITAETIREKKGLNASIAWKEAVSQAIGRTALNREDEALLLVFGELLGRSDTEGQIKNIRLAISQLKRQEEKAEENRKKNERMYRQLGILAGAAIVIALL